MKQQHYNRLSVKTYLAALEGVETQFALIRFALSELSKSAIKKFLRERLDRQLSGITAFYAMGRSITQKEDTGEMGRTEKSVREVIKKEHKKDSKPSDNRFKIELSEDRLNQSELLLLVAHFESFMKEVHQTFLQAAPGRVFSNRDTKVMLRDLFHTGNGRHFEKFLNELIIKEVKSLDAQRIGQRVDYFSKNFGVSFDSQKEIHDLEQIMETRNKISHEIYCPPPPSLEQVKELPIVDDEMLRRARLLFRDIPQRCVEVGAKAYQSYFQQ